MTVESGFDDLQGEVNTDPDNLAEARRRRDFFRTAFDQEPEIEVVMPSGSLARGTHIEPINDVDVILIFKRDSHPDWGEPGVSAVEALRYTATRVKALLGDPDGEVASEVRLASPRNHTVKCFLDDPNDPEGFTVDATPALRNDDGTLLIPEAESSKWIVTNPEYLMDEIAKRNDEWNEFARLVRVLKFWNRYVSAGMLPLLIEVLAYHHLPQATRPKAIQRFFTAASVAIGGSIEDPAGLCGPIQPDLDVASARKKIDEAADLSFQAVAAQDNDEDEAMCLWRKVFGEAFPEPESGCKEKAFGAVPLIGTVRPRRVRDEPQG